MGYELSASILNQLWDTLRQPDCFRRDERTAKINAIANDGWATNLLMQDVLEAMDRRLTHLTDSWLGEVLKSSGLQTRGISLRPKYWNDRPMAYEGLSSADFANLMIYMERLGFNINPLPLIKLILPTISDRSYVSEEECRLLFYEKRRHRYQPLILSARDVEIFGLKKSVEKLNNGYRLEYTENSNNEVLWLEVKSPKYRARKELGLFTCPECGMSYMKGEPSENAMHRNSHREALLSLKPNPHKKFLNYREKVASAQWVDAKSPQWLHREMYGRALAFKREMGYDFPQWDITPKPDEPAVGYLFTDDEGRIFGACCFRPRKYTPERPWSLDWIWIAPLYRCQGIVSACWKELRTRFGDFDIEKPVSTAMQKFLIKHGDAELLTRVNE